MPSASTAIPNPKALQVARSHEIQLALRHRDVPEFESIPLIGMCVQIALHLRGLARVDPEVLKLVAVHFFHIPRPLVEPALQKLADAEFIRLVTKGGHIKAIIPTVPYYSDFYDQFGAYCEDNFRLNEAEQLALALTDRLAASPENEDKTRAALGAEPKLFARNIDIGTQGKFLVRRRHRGRSILLNPQYFSENASIFADHVAGTGSDSLKNLLAALRRYQGWPLELMEKEGRLGDLTLDANDLALMRRLAQDGAVKPPAITTSKWGETHFIFTPAPLGASVGPLQREVYEKAMAVLAAVRQGQLLPKKFAIRSPGAVLYTLKTELALGSATTEAREQYKNLVHLRIGKLVPTGGNYFAFKIVDTPENREALDIAYDLLHEGESPSTVVDKSARQALQEDQEYVESLVAAAELRQRETIRLPRDMEESLALLLQMGGG